MHHHESGNGHGLGTGKLYFEDSSAESQIGLTVNKYW